LNRRREITARNILLYLATHGESNKWQIAKGLGKAYSNIHENMRDLLKNGFARVTKEEKSARNWKIKVEYYDLSFIGLVGIMYYEETWQFLDEVARTQAGFLPLVFGKWEYFEKKGVRGTVVLRLRFAFSGLSIVSKQVYDTLKGSDGQELRDITRKLRESSLVRDPSFWKEQLNRITETVIFLWPHLEAPDEQRQFLLALKDDPDLSHYVEESLSSMEERYQGYLDNIVALKALWGS